MAEVFRSFTKRDFAGIGERGENPRQCRYGNPPHAESPSTKLRTICRVVSRSKERTDFAESDPLLVQGLFRLRATEAKKEKISVSPQEITERINAIKKSMNLSDKDFEGFLKNHSMNLSSFEKRMEKDLMIANLIAKGAEKGLTKEAWIKELNSRATVEILSK